MQGWCSRPPRTPRSVPCCGAWPGRALTTPFRRLPLYDAFLRVVRATNPALMGATVRDAPHCWQRKNMMRVELSLSSSVSGLLQLLHSTYLGKGWGGAQRRGWDGSACVVEGWHVNG